MKLNVLLVFIYCSCLAATAKPISSLDPEEQRVGKAHQMLGEKITPLVESIESFKLALVNTTSFSQSQRIVSNHAESLWYSAINQIKASNSYDDRPLYWARLLGRISLKQHDFPFQLSSKQQAVLLQLWEDGSRGLTTISYSDDPTIDRIFLTGFDPFLLDRNIDQSNPSGVTALLLDGVIFEFKGKKIQIETVMIPVRFDDFDQDLIERILTPLMAPEKKIDLITTISMGRKSFDLERFPGKRRSATISGNRNVITGASPVNPLIPLLKSKAHDSAEFVEFSLPVKLMQQATGVFKINDNHQVTTLAKGKISPQSLTELTNEISVQGSGGSYLSNEISYRSIALRDKLASDMAIGHIHTPRIKSFEPLVIKQTVTQITEMLKHASTSFK
ncbi:MAG: hypothetical protein HRU24_10165 [Gammaproteobacteria bacterium]|nr:hypothetical protein [Gammaproteobacteria bacterium]